MISTSSIVISSFIDLFDIQPTLYARLEEDLRLDSLDTVSLIQLLEQKFDIFVPNNDIYRLRTVQDIVNVVNKIQQQN